MKYKYKKHELEIYEKEGDKVGVTKSVYDGLNLHYIYQDTVEQVKKEFRNYIDNFLHKRRN